MTNASITAILAHIANELALMTFIEASFPELLVDGQQRIGGGMARTATVPAGDTPRDGPVGLYANLTPDQVVFWQALAANPALGITILGQRPYGGLGTGPALYAQVQEDATAWALWAAVATVPAHEVPGEEGGMIPVPERIEMPYVQ